jgi:hypothetical protein
VLESLSSIHKVLGSILSTAKNKKIKIATSQAKSNFLKINIK